VTAPLKEYERYVELVDREACEEPLNPAEREFCRLFEERYPGSCPELQLYAELADLNAPPDATSRALVDRALEQLEQLDAEDRARATHDTRLLRRAHATAWPTLIGVAAFALGATYALIERAPQGPAGTPAPAGNPTSPLVRAELVYASGNVNVSGSNAAAGRALLSQGSVIETKAGGACILIDSDINVCLGADSRMRLKQVAGPERRIDLEAGKLATRLSPQSEGMSLSIVADGVVSTALGTAFSVERTAEHSVVTTVLNGKVRVTGATETQEATLVNAHERAVTSTSGDRSVAAADTASSSTSTQRTRVISVRRTEEAPSWVLLGPTVLWHDPVAATLEVRGEPEGADAWLDDQWLGSTPVSSLIPVGEHRIVVRKDHRELLSSEFHVMAGATQAVHYERGPNPPNDDAARPDHADPSELEASRDSDRARDKAEPANKRATLLDGSQRAELKAPNAQRTQDAAELLHQARQAMRNAQFQDAAQLYEKLIATSPDSDEAHTALVALGQLRLNQLEDPNGALAPLESYLQKGGANAVEARAARIQALRELKRTGDEARAIEEFLTRHPNSFEGKRMRTRLDDLRATAATH